MKLIEVVMATSIFFIFFLGLSQMVFVFKKVNEQTQLYNQKTEMLEFVFSDFNNKVSSGALEQFAHQEIWKAQNHAMFQITGDTIRIKKAEKNTIVIYEYTFLQQNEEYAVTAVFERKFP